MGNASWAFARSCRPSTFGTWVVSPEGSAVGKLRPPTFGRPAPRIRSLVLPDDPIPQADAIVSIGHVLNYLPDAAEIHRALVAIAGALRRSGLLAMDLYDRTYWEATSGDAFRDRLTEDRAIITDPIPAIPGFVRQMAIFTRNGDGSWRRDDDHRFLEGLHTILERRIA